MCLNSRLLIATYSLACSRLRDSCAGSAKLRKSEHEKETVAPFSPTNHARALHLGVIPTIWEPGKSYTQSNPALRTISCLSLVKESPYIFSKFNPLNMDTPLIRTLWRYGPSVSVLTAFDGVRKKITRNIRSCLIGKSGFRFWNPDFRFCNRTRIRKLVGKTTVLKDSFWNPFSDSQSNGKIETSKTDISALKSFFGFRVRLQIRYPVLNS